jgi:hypothetical protein
MQVKMISGLGALFGPANARVNSFCVGLRGRASLLVKFTVEWDGKTVVPWDGLFSVFIASFLTADGQSCFLTMAGLRTHN